VSRRRVVITGLGPVTPIGVGVEPFWNALLEKKNAVRRIESFDPSEFDSQMGSEIGEIKLADYVPKSYRKGAKVMARDIVLAVVAAHQAVSDAQLRTRCLLDRGEADGEPNFDPTRLGVNIGAGLICADLNELASALHAASHDGVFSLKTWGEEGMNNLTPLWLLKFLPNMVACHVTIVHDAQAPSNTITCGEASSYLAIGEACRTIERDAADVCICGGSESKLNPMALVRQSLGKFLSRRNDDPQKAVRPFGVGRDGTAISEGSGLVILEELEHARARGARIYAELVGFGASHDAYKPSTFDPNGSGVQLSAEKALRDAGATAADVDAVVAFGSGQPERDLAEARGIRAVLGDRAEQTPTMCFKGGLGNNGAGAAAIDLIGGVLATHHSTIPPSLNTESIDPECGLRVHADGPVDARLDHILCTSYALNGAQNASLVLRRYRD
jgi:3-oxoacyl-[acyl-carrier-protein] synthase II